LPELHHALYFENLHVVAITETWLNSKIPDGLLDPNNKYHIFRCDRNERRGGGVCVLVNRDLGAINVSVSDAYTDVELLCIDIIGHNFKCRVITVYRSTDDAHQSEMQTKLLFQCVENLSCVGWPCFVIGDLNAPAINWSNLTVPPNCPDSYVLNFAINNGFTQMVNKPTRKGNILDLVFTNEPNTVFDITIDSPFGNSDHHRVNFTLAFEQVVSKAPTTTEYGSETTTGIKRYQWSNADFDGMSDYLSNYDWTNLFSTNLTVNSMWSAFSDVLHCAIDLYVPASNSITPKRRMVCPKNCRKALARKRCLWRKHRADPGNSSLLQKYKAAEENCRHALREAELKRERQIISNNNLGSFYKHVNSRLTCRTGVGVLRKGDGTVAATDTSKAELLNNYFGSVCTKDDGFLPAFDKLVPENVAFSNVTFTPENVERVMRKLKKSASSGPDGFPPILFIKQAAYLAVPLSILFNNSMSVGEIPDDWRKAIITPIAKGGVASDVSNYRPIALTSVVCKIMERVIVQHLLNYLYQHGLISHHQHGFLKRKSTTTNLLESLNDWTLAFDNKDGTTVAYIDYAKAFDSVSHQKLCHKLLSYGISGSILAWIKSFLSARTQCTRVGSSLSCSEYVISGVIQGSCLGPILFVLYINDIIKLFDWRCTCKLYADDLKLYMRMNLPDCSNTFQNCLKDLEHWSRTWQLNIAYKKCSVLQINRTSRISQHNDYYLNSNVIVGASVVKDLGVFVDERLNFDSHINYIVARASVRANLIHKCFLSKDPATMAKAFKVYVRPLLEYASQAWSPYQLKDIKRIESVQRHFTKRLSGLSHLNYTNRLKYLGLETLELRRLHHDLIYTYKVLFGKTDMDCANMFTVARYTTNRGHPWKLYAHYCRTSLRKHYFCERVVAPWNHLRITNATLRSVAAFKSLVKNTDLSSFLYTCNGS